MLWSTLPSSLGHLEDGGTERSRRQAAWTDVGLERRRLWQAKGEAEREGRTELMSAFETKVCVLCVCTSGDGGVAGARRVLFRHFACVSRWKLSSGH